MKVLGVIGLGVVLAASLSTTVMADGPKVERVDPFTKADANGDGKLSLEEFKTMVTNDAEAKFTAADIDKDGFVTRAELKAAKEAAHEARKAAAAKAAMDAPPVAHPAPAVPAAPVAPAR